MENPPRLVIDGRRLGARRTGVGRYLERLLIDWAGDGWPLDRVLLVLHESTAFDRVPRHPTLEIRTIGEGWPGLVWEWFGLGSLLTRGDILFAPTNLLPRRWRGPSVLVAFDTLLESVPQGFSLATRLRFARRYRDAARRATRVIVPSEATAQDVVERYGVEPHQLRMIYPSIGEGFRPREADDPLVMAAKEEFGIGTEPFFLFVGKRSARRNLPSILEGFHRHRSEHPSHRLIFVGPGGGGLSSSGDGVIYAGHVTDDHLLGLMAGATALLYPSDHEGFGLPVAEAMASGCPVVTLRRGALSESGGGAAYYLDAPSPEAIAGALRDLTRRDGPRSRYISLGLAQAARFQGPGFARAVCDVIREVAGFYRGDQPEWAGPAGVSTAS